MNSLRSIAENFLNVYWIRPETAIWRTLDVKQMSDVKFKHPIIDMGCADGVFSFIKFGGKFDLGFDTFRIKNAIEGFHSGRDIYDQTTNYNPKIIKKPKITIDVGLDWKKNLLKKAEKLNFYGELVQHDLNKKLPFEDNSFSTIFSNVYYWVENIPQLLKESNRILMKDGKMILMVPDENFKEWLIYNRFLKRKQKWAKILDRGQYNNMKHCYSFKKWKKMFNDAGFKIEKHSGYLSKGFLQYCDIASRPYSPYMIEMSNNLSEQKRKNIKKQLIKDFLPICASYVESKNKDEKQPGYHCFVLKK